MKKVIAFEWDNAKGEDHNGKSLMIGQHLPERQSPDLTHVEMYGISITIIDDSKDFRLKWYSCYSGNVASEVVEISKESARNLLIKQLDNALDILYNESDMEDVDTEYNVSQEDLEDDDFED